VWFKECELYKLDEENAPNPKNIIWGVPIEDLNI
jgi:hypothetical protein